MQTKANLTSIAMINPLLTESEECGATALLYVFFGITAALFGFRPLYAIFFLLVFLFLWLFEAFGPPFLELMLFYGFGIAIGALYHYMLPTVAWLPQRVSNFGSVAFLLAQLAFMAVAFLVVDVRIPETNWPVGYLVSFVIYTGWFIFAYIVNYSYYKLADAPYANVVIYNCTYIYWFMSMVPFYIAFAPCVLRPLWAAVLGTLLSLPVVFYLTYLTDLGKTKAQAA